MEGLVYLLNQAGIALAQSQQALATAKDRIGQLEANVASLQSHADRTPEQEVTTE